MTVEARDTPRAEAEGSKQAYPTLAEAFRVWSRVALMSFGGPAGQIAVMHRILVEEKRWIGEQRFLHALNFCMLLPGPEAQQLTVYVGWLMHRTLGGVMAGVLFVLPGLVSIMALSWIYVIFGDVTAVEGLFFGLKAAVLAIVVHAVVRIGRRALRSSVMIAVAAASFVAIYGFAVPFPAIIAAAALIGFLGGRAGLPSFRLGGGHKGDGKNEYSDEGSLLGSELPPHGSHGTGWSLRMGAVLLVIWLAPTALLYVLLGPDNVFSNIALFFSQMAVVTFGGAYAVLAYVAQAAVESYGWLEPGEMLDGLGLAETTPGPLIMVVQFVGFLAAFREAGAMPPLLAGTLGGLLTTWVTFAPCFLWIFLAAPYVEQLRNNRALAAALGTVTAAVVGVILNLALWFGLHVLFAEVYTLRSFGLDLDLPALRSIDPLSALLSLGAIIALFRFQLGAAWVLLACALAGLALALAGMR